MSFTGQVVEIPLGQDGLTGTKHMSQVLPGQLIQATNITFENGPLQKEGGATQHSAFVVAGGIPILGGWDWWPTPTQQRTVVFTGAAEIYRDNGDGVWAFGMGNAGSAALIPVFVEGGREAQGRNRKLFIFSGGGSQVISGDATTTYLLGGTGVAPPAAVVAAIPSPAVAGNVDNGTHSFLATYLTSTNGESIAGVGSNVITITDKTVNGQVDLTLPLGPPGTAKRNIYMTSAGNVLPYKYATTINDNTTTTYRLNLADASLMAAINPPAVSSFGARPPEWHPNSYPTFGFLHNGRLVVGGSPTDPHRVWISLLNDHENFIDTGAQNLAIYPGEGERLVGGVSFKGLAILWKYPRGIYVIDTTNPVPSNWTVNRLSSSIGGVSPMGQVLIDDDMLFIDATGTFQLLSGIQQFGDLGSQNLSQVAQLNTFIRDNVELSALSRTQAIYYVAKREVHFAVCGKGETLYPNRRLVIDFNQLEKPRFRWSNRDSNPALWLRRDSTNVPRLVCGDTSGHVWLLDQDTRSKGGAGYEARFQTPYLDFAYADPSLATKRKNGRFLEFNIEPRGNWDLTVNIWWDGDLHETVTFSMNPSGIALGTFIIGTHELGSSKLLTRRRRITGSGHRFSIECFNSGAGQDFSIAGARLYFDPSDERLM